MKRGEFIKNLFGALIAGPAVAKGVLKGESEIEPVDIPTITQDIPELTFHESRNEPIIIVKRGVYQVMRVVESEGGLSTNLEIMDLSPGDVINWRYPRCPEFIKEYSIQAVEVSK